LEFLQASLPDTPINTLKQALKDVEESGRELDMWNLIGNILSQEYTRELEERGLSNNNDVIGGWGFVRQKPQKSASPDKRKRSQATKITLVDICQQNQCIRQHRKYIIRVLNFFHPNSFMDLHCCPPAQVSSPLAGVYCLF